MSSGESDAFGYVDENGFYCLEGYAITFEGSHGEVTFRPRFLEHPGMDLSINSLGGEMAVVLRGWDGGVDWRDEWRIVMPLYVRVADLEVFGRELRQLHAEERATASLSFKPHDPRGFKLTLRDSGHHVVTVACGLSIPLWDRSASTWQTSYDDVPFRVCCAFDVWISRQSLTTTSRQIGAVLRQLRDAE